MSCAKIAPMQCISTLHAIVKLIVITVLHRWQIPCKSQTLSWIAAGLPVIAIGIIWKPEPFLGKTGHMSTETQPFARKVAPNFSEIAPVWHFLRHIIGHWCHFWRQFRKHECFTKLIPGTEGLTTRNLYQEQVWSRVEGRVYCTIDVAAQWRNHADKLFF